MKDNLGFPFILAFSSHFPLVPPPSFPLFRVHTAEAQTTETKQNKRKNNSPSERWHRDVLFIFHRNGKLGGLSRFLGGGDLFDMSRVDFLSFPIYWQNEERRNIGFGNKEPITLKNDILYLLAMIRSRPFFFFETERERREIKETEVISCLKKACMGEDFLDGRGWYLVPHGAGGSPRQTPSPFLLPRPFHLPLCLREHASSS